MKTKVYKNNMDGLTEYIVDIDNTFKIKSFMNMCFTRTNGRETYGQTLENLISDEVKSKFSVIYENGQTYVRVVIDAFEVKATTRYSSMQFNNGYGETSFVFEIQQVEKLMGIEEFLLDDGEISFIRAEKSADFIIKDHINQQIKKIFTSGTIDTERTWSFNTTNYDAIPNYEIVTEFEKIIKS